MLLARKLEGRRVVLRWLAVVLWAIFIFFMSSRDATQLSEGFFEQVKQLLAAVLNALLGYHEDPVSPFCHFCEYAVLGALLANALRAHMQSLRTACLAGIAMASAYGITDEIHQLFVPGRFCDPADWVVDTCGAALGALVLYLVVRFRHGASCDRGRQGTHDAALGSELR